MIITKLRINNYKSIEDMALEFVKGKNIIVGQNNSGKSRLLRHIVKSKDVFPLCDLEIENNKKERL